MRFNRDIFGIMVLLVLFIAGGVLLGGRGDTKSRQVGKEDMPDSSIYNDRASGSKGLFEWVDRQKYQAEVWRHGWDTLGQSGAAVLLVIDPRSQESFVPLTGGSGAGSGKPDPTILSASDAASLRDWLRAGHTAVLMTSRLSSGRASGDPDSFADALDLIVESASSGGRTEFAPLQPSRDTRGVLTVHSDSNARIRRQTPDGVTLFGDAGGPLALDVPVGAGHLIAIADAGFASNTSLLRSENAAFLANLLADYAHPGNRILFDEYHHGEADEAAGATVWTVLGRPLQLVIIQLGFAVVVLFGVLAIRFGAPAPLLRGVTRTSAEYVTSVAMLYQRAEASAAALDVLYRQFLRDVSSRLALAPDVNLEQLAEVAARRGHTEKAALRRLLAACESGLDAGRVSEAELLDLTRQMERIRKDMGIA